MKKRSVKISILFLVRNKLNFRDVNFYRKKGTETELKIK